MEPNNQHLCSLSDKHDLKDIIKGPTCFKSPKGRCFDFSLTNKRHSLMKTQSFETGFNDHHHLIYTTLKITYDKVPPKKLIYRDYKMVRRVLCVRLDAKSPVYANDQLQKFQTSF